MTLLLCTSPQCQSTAGCVCGYIHPQARTKEIELMALRNFLHGYRQHYMDTQTNPTPRQEADVMLLARIATQARGNLT